MTLRFRLFVSAAFLLPFASPAVAQDAQPEAGAPAEGQQPAEEPLADEEYDEEGDEIVVVGQRLPGSVIGDIPPEDTLDPRDIRATGATDINELLEALAPQLGSARGRGGERPVVLLNGQRISGFREVRDIPPEAIRRVEILPEEVALKYGYRADQRVVNIVLRPRFRSTVARLEASSPTEGGTASGEADLTRMIIRNNARTTLDLDVEANSALSESERDVALEEGAAIDDRAARTLVGSRRQVTATATHSRPLLGAAATGNVEYERIDGESLLGFPAMADGTPIAGDPRDRDSSSDGIHAGVALNWQKSRWRYSATGNADWLRSVTETDPGQVDPLVEYGRDRSRSTRASVDLDATAHGPLFAVPAGDASITIKAGASSFNLDSSRRAEGEIVSNSLSRTQGNAGFNFDLPVSRRNRDFDALGNLTLNANGEVQQLSDFGTLTSIGAGLNWSPANPLNLIVSWTREEGAPGIQQLGDPLLETAGFRIFDFTRGETVEVTALTGGNPELRADSRNVFKIGGNWRPLGETDLRLRAEYVRSILDDPVSSFPGPSEALETAFPDRFERDPDGRLVRVDLRPVNFDQARRETFRWGIDFTKPLRSQRPSDEQMRQMRARFFGDGAGQGGRPGAAPPADGPVGAQAGERGGRRFGGGRFGGRRGGRLTLSLTHTVNLVDEVTIAPGLPELDYLSGDALGSSGGRPRHQVEAQAGWANNGLGARLAANWRSATEVESAQAGSLRFSPLATFDLRLFANLGERFDLVSKHPWLRGTQIRFEARNLFDSRPEVRDAAGEVPFNYQPALLDSQGRTVGISIRKLFVPRPQPRRRTAN